MVFDDIILPPTTEPSLFGKFISLFGSSADEDVEKLAATYWHSCFNVYLGTIMKEFLQTSQGIGNMKFSQLILYIDGLLNAFLSPYYMYMGKSMYGYPYSYRRDWNKGNKDNIKSVCHSYITLFCLLDIFG